MYFFERLKLCIAAPFNRQTYGKRFNSHSYFHKIVKTCIIKVAENALGTFGFFLKVSDKCPFSGADFHKSQSLKDPKRFAYTGAAHL